MRFKRWYACASTSAVHSRPSCIAMVRWCSGSVSGHRTALIKPPNAQSPFAQCRHYPCWRMSDPSLRGRYSPVVAHTDSFANPIWLFLPSALASYKKSSQVATSPCCQRDLPDVISANPSSDAWSLATAVPRSAFTCFFLRVIGLPHEVMGRLPATVREYDFSRVAFSTLQTFLDVQASAFARPPGRSHRCKCSAGQPGLLHPG